MKHSQRTGIKPKDKIEWILRSEGIEYQKEYRFHPERKFRFDYCIPEKKIAIEYEGLFTFVKDEQGKTKLGKSRHTTVSGYEKDTEKYNLAAINGWLVLRYTASTINNLFNDIQQLKRLWQQSK